MMLDRRCIIRCIVNRRSIGLCQGGTTDDPIRLLKKTSTPGRWGHALIRLQGSILAAR
jgi:hypothetical protein